MIAYCQELEDESVAFFGASGFGAFLANYFPKKAACIADEDKGRYKMSFAKLKILNPSQCEKPILVAFRNKEASQMIVTELKERYPKQEFVDLFAKL